MIVNQQNLTQADVCSSECGEQFAQWIYSRGLLDSCLRSPASYGKAGPLEVTVYRFCQARFYR